MDYYNLITKIPHALLFLLGVSVVLYIFIGGLHSINATVKEYNAQDYPKAIVLENLMSLDTNTSTRLYDYPHRRSVIPIEYFTNKASDPMTPSYRKKNGHCYIKKVDGLDGENFAFYVKPLYDKSKPSSYVSNARSLDCTTTHSRSEAVFAPALLVRKAHGNPMLPVRIYVYPVQ
ncbi:MAG: hypothetical protein ABEJ69_00895 [Candidatus Nanohaloarchaea archaeon]